MTTPTRRSFITGLVALVAAPAIVRAGSLMPVKLMIEPYGVGPAMSVVDILNRMLIEMAERQINPVSFIDPSAAKRTFLDLNGFVRSEMVAAR